jgi:hypothetical protein
VLFRSGGLIGLSNGGEIGKTNNPNFWITAAIAAKEAGHMPQGQADVAQSIYNRAKVGIYPGGRDIRKIITASGQYQPTFGNPGAWNSIKDKNTAINAVKDAKLIDMAAKSISDSSLQRNAANFVGSRTDFQGESQKPHMKPNKGDITRGKRHNFFGWFTENAEKSKLPGPASSPFPPSNLVGPKIVGEKKVGSGIPGIPPILHNMQQKMQKKQGGGVVKESDGSHNPNSATDRRSFPIINSSKVMGIAALQPGEGIVTKRAMESGGETLVQNINALLDPNSEAAKSGVRSAMISSTKIKKPNISPPSNSRGRIASMTLPPITQSAGSAPTSSGGGTQVPPFSTVSPASMFVRINNADTYGIVG